MPATQVRVIEREAPLSLQQEREFLMTRLAPGNVFDNLPPIGLRVAGPLDIDALREALRRVVARHEMLRSTIHDLDGAPFQAVLDSLDVPLIVDDLRDSPLENLEADVTILLGRYAVQPYDIATGPLLRAGVIRLRRNDHVLFFAMHHIVSDLWSYRLFLAEWAGFYSAIVTDRPAVLLPLTAQYADFAIWQRQWLAGPTLEQELDYWRQRLDGAQPVRLPIDRVRNPTTSHDGGIVTARLGPQLSTSLVRMAAQEHATPFMLFLAIYKILLWSFHRQDDIVVGSPYANRERVETDPLIGHFAHTLALRTRLSAELTVREVLRRVRETCWEAYSHPHVPFWRVAQELNWGVASIVMLQMQRVPIVMPTFAGLALRPFHCTGVSLFGAAAPTRQFDLCCEVWDQGTVDFTGQPNYDLVVSYRNDCFSAASAGRVVQRFKQCIEECIASGDQTIEAITAMLEQGVYV